MKTIIVATDFSEAATNAVNYSAHLAAGLHASLLLLHVYQPPIPVSEIPIIIDRDKYIFESEKALIDLKNELTQRVGGDLNIQYTIAEQTFFESLSAACNKWQPYLVVLGSQGSTGVDRFMMGSHAVYTSKHLPWPVLTIPPEAIFNGIKKIGLACDLHDVNAIIPAKTLNLLLNDLKAELHVLNVGKASDYDPDLVPGSASLAKLLENTKPVFHFLTGNNSFEEIISFVDETGLDLLITVLRQHNFIYSLTHRSHTSYFIMHSRIPVLTLGKAIQHKGADTVQMTNDSNTNRL